MANTVRIVVTAVDQATSTLNKSKASAERLGGAVTKMSAAGVVGMAAFGAASLKAAVGFESAFAGVEKTVDGTAQEMDALKSGIRDMAKELPASATEIAGVAEAAGQLGIKTKDILGFSKVMVDLGESTNLSARDAATALARLANITGMPATEFDRLGSTVVDLGNNLATTEAEIVEMGLRLAGAGTQIGLTEAQILGFAGALSSVGIEAQMGGTAVSRVMVDIASAVAVGGAKLARFANVAGMSVDDFSRAFKTDAAGAIITFIEGLGRMSAAGENVFGVLEEMGLGEVRVRDALLRASGAGDLFRNSIELGSKAWQENTALTEEAERRYATTAAQFEMLKNEITDMSISMGNKLIPATRGAIGAGKDMAQAFDSLPGSTQKLVLGVTAVTVAAPAATAGIQKLTAAVKAMRTAKMSAGMAAGGLAVGLGALAIGVDVLLQKKTGHGLITHLFGDPKRIDATTAAVDRLETSLKTFADGEVFSKEAERLARAQEDLNKEMPKGARESKKLADAWRDGKYTSSELRGEVDALIDVMGRNEATAADYRDVMETLPPVLREQIQNSAGYRAALQLQSEQMQQAVKDEDDQIRALKESGRATKSLATEIPKAKGALDAFDESVATSEDGVKDFTKALDGLIDTFAETNPQVIAAEAMSAALGEEIADLEDHYDDLSDAEKTHLENLKKQKEGYDLTAKGGRDNQAAAEGQRKAIEGLIGERGYGGLISTMNEVNRPQESQLGILARLSQAYQALANNDVPAFRAIMAGLKGDLSPEEWGALTANMTIAMASGFESGGMRISAAARGVIDDALGGSARVGMNVVAYDTGRQMGSATAAGMDSAAGQIQTAGRNVAANMQAGVNSYGPVYVGIQPAITPGFQTQYAHGTSHARRGLALVGEEGPEVVAFGGGEKVFTAPQTRSMLSGGGGGGVTINISGNFYGVPSDDFLRSVREGLQRAGVGI